jgi:hypothetical protein
VYSFLLAYEGLSLVKGVRSIQGAVHFLPADKTHISGLWKDKSVFDRAMFFCGKMSVEPEATALEVERSRGQSPVSTEAVEIRGVVRGQGLCSSLHNTHYTYLHTY